MKKLFVLPIAAAFALTSTFGLGLGMTSAAAAVGGDNPITVGDPSEVPDGAVQTGQTRDECETTTTWTLTVPANEETSHEEFRHKREILAVEAESHQEWGVEERTRTLTPGQDEETKTVYSYKKKVERFTTEYRHQYQKQVRGNVEEHQGQSWTTIGTFPFEFWNSANGWGTAGSFQWGDWGQEVAVLESGGHSDVSDPFDGNKRKVSTAYQYAKNGSSESRQVSDGYDYVHSGEVDSPLGSPWVLLDGYPKTVVVTEDVPASYGPWTDWETTESGLLSAPVLPADTDVREYRAAGPVEAVDQEYVAGYTEYYVLGGEPSRDETDASWLLAEQAPGGGWTVFDERTVAHGDGTPEVVTYYAFADGVECDKPTEPPVTPEPSDDAEPEVLAAQQTTVQVPTAVDAGLGTDPTVAAMAGKTSPETGSSMIVLSLALMAALTGLVLLRRRA